MIANELALALVVLKVIGEQIKTGKGVADCEIRDTATPDDRTAAVLPDGTKVGTVSLANPRTTVKVVDRAAFTAWVAEHYPTEVETAPAVRAAFEKRVLDDCKSNGNAVDSHGLPVPGVTIGFGEPYPIVRLIPGAEQAIADAFQAGRLAHVVERYTRPAIEAGETR